MLDDRLRTGKDRLLGPLVRFLAPRVSPTVLSALSLALGLGAAVAASRSLVAVSLVLFLLGRLADGLDGAVARRRGSGTDLGGFVDLLGDVAVYAAIPLGVAVAADDVGTWTAAAVLLATFYVNAVCWMFLAAVDARRTADRGAAGPSGTTIPMTAGLIEGTETIVLYAAILAFPAAATTWFWIMAALVAITILQRIRLARRWLAT